MQWVLWENDFLFLNWCFKVKILPFLYGQLDYFLFHFSEKAEAWFKAAKCTNYFSRMEGYSFLIHGCVISLVEIEMCACIVHLMCDNFIWYVICPYFVFPLPWKPQQKKMRQMFMTILFSHFLINIIVFVLFQKKKNFFLCKKDCKHIVTIN